jgi:hypothetical protein
MAPQRPASDVAFTPAVKAVQSRLGSRKAYARMETGEGWATEVSDELAGFIAEQTSFFLATANAAGQPYIQHRGGAPGFLRVLDPNTLAFADFRGNRQYISLGNLAENAKVHLFLVDYATRQRIKIWGEASVVEDDRARIDSLVVPGYPARAERAIVIRAEKDRRIAELEAQLRATRRS